MEPRKLNWSYTDSSPNFNNLLLPVGYCAKLIDFDNVKLFLFVYIIFLWLWWYSYYCWLPDFIDPLSGIEHNQHRKYGTGSCIAIHILSANRLPSTTTTSASAIYIFISYNKTQNRQFNNVKIQVASSTYWRSLRRRSSLCHTPVYIHNSCLSSCKQLTD